MSRLVWRKCPINIRGPITFSLSHAQFLLVKYICIFKKRFFCICKRTKQDCQKKKPCLKILHLQTFLNFISEDWYDFLSPVQSWSNLAPNLITIIKTLSASEKSYWGHQNTVKYINPEKFD